MGTKKSILLIGYGAIGATVASAMGESSNAEITHVLVKPGREENARKALGSSVMPVSDLPLFLQSGQRMDVVAECAGHAALKEYGSEILSAGIDLFSVSCGAIADAHLANALRVAAESGESQLKLLSGAVGGLDALSSGAVGKLEQVRYCGRKPPRGWSGSAAESIVDLATVEKPVTHFNGNAGTAAKQYPKNANVAASIAFAGIGFDDTQVELIVDPDTNSNVHEIQAQGEFGTFTMRIEGNALEGNPKSSALAAFSMVRALRNRYSPICVGL